MFAMLQLERSGTEQGSLKLPGMKIA